MSWSVSTGTVANEHAGLSIDALSVENANAGTLEQLEVGKDVARLVASKFTDPFLSVAIYGHEGEPGSNSLTVSVSGAREPGT